MKWFYHLKTSVKLISAFIIIAIILAFVGFYGLSNLSKLNSSLNSMYANSLIPIDLIADAQAARLRLKVNTRDIYLAESAVEKENYIKASQEDRIIVEKSIQAYGKTHLTDVEKERLDKFQLSWITYSKSYDQLIAFSQTNKKQEVRTLMYGEITKQGSELQEIMNAISDNNVNAAELANKAASSLYSSSRLITIVIIMASLLISVLFGFVISQVIARPLQRVVALIGKVANGDLRETSDIDTKDEVGQLAKSLNMMVLSLRNTVSGILRSVDSVSASAQQISASTEEIASGSTSQAKAAQTMNDLFRELSFAINSVARGAEQAAEMSSKTTKIALEGGVIVRSSIDGMDMVSKQMARLEEDSNRIGEIIEVIDDIADQTNLLALNAAIEAARAGDQGRGFAVVADEVRKLAERSSEATKQITLIIKGIQANTHQSVTVVGEGVISTRKTGEAFEHIISMVSDAADKVSEIAAASEEQSAQSSEVMLSIESISAVTEESAASSEETAATAQSLAELAESLNQAVAIFKIR